MTRSIHQFDNGIKVYDDHLIPAQRERYAVCNVHEADEDIVFDKIIKTLPSDACFINIGAAIGYYLLLARQLSPNLTIHAFEPLERHRECILENAELNAVPSGFFTLHPEGVAAEVGTTTFVDHGYGSHIQATTQPRLAKRIKQGIRKALHIEKPAKPLPGSHTISTLTLDAIIDTIKQPIDLCLMDVQGLEADVLSGGITCMPKGAIRTFLIGTHSSELHESCKKRLTDANYVIEVDDFHTAHQPDGILVASHGRKYL